MIINITLFVSFININNVIIRAYFPLQSSFEILVAKKVKLQIDLKEDNF